MNSSEQRDARFAAGYERLTAYAQRHGTANVPYGYVTTDGFRLGAWVDVKRKAFRAGRLPDERVALLTGLGLDWAPGRGVGRRALENGGQARAAARRRDTGDTFAQQALTALAAFIATHGHGDVPLRHITPDGLQLGAWLARQRHSHRRGTLRPWLYAALTALEVDWEPHRRRHRLGQRTRSTTAFQVGLQHYRHFRHRYGRDPKLGERTTDGYRVGRWVQRQRDAHRAGALPAARAAAVAAAGLYLGPSPGTGTSAPSTPAR